MKYMILIGILSLLVLSGCSGRDTFESECFGNCIDAKDCEFKGSGTYHNNNIEFNKCQENCFYLCYNNTLVNEQKNDSRIKRN